jgi:Ca-activated chloride channel homolog
MKWYGLGLFCFLWVVGLEAQTLRGLKQQGTEAYDKGEYGLAYDKFTQALDKKNEWTTLYNLSNTHYQLQEYQRAAEGYLALLDEEMEDAIKASVYHNLGNCYFQMNALEESFDAYKKALLLSPGDHDTKMNLSKVIRMRQQKKDNSDANEENSDQKEDPSNQKEDNAKPEEGDSDQREDPSEEEGKDQDGQGQEEESEGSAQQGQEDPSEAVSQEGGAEREGAMSKEQAEQLLKIIEEEEKKVLEKLRTIPSTGKKSEKDW